MLWLQTASLPPRFRIARRLLYETLPASRDSICRLFFLLASPTQTPPPSYEDTTAEIGGPALAQPQQNSSRPQLRRPSGAHPRFAVLLGIKAHWNVPLLICRALSTVPALWWGLRCALTFLSELLLNDRMGLIEETWSVEKRFRVTEVFLAILWV